MKMDTIPWQTRALAAFQELPDEERKRVVQELSHWWPLPRGSWPAERLVRSSKRLDEELFMIDDHWGIGVRWHEEHAVEITTVRRRTLKIVSTEKPKPAWRNPDILLGWAVAAFLAGVVFYLLSAMGEGSTQGASAEPSLGGQVFGTLSLISFVAGAFLLLRCFFRSR